jgi:hypothetical protein
MLEIDHVRGDGRVRNTNLLRVDGGPRTYPGRPCFNKLSQYAALDYVCRELWVGLVMVIGHAPPAMFVLLLFVCVSALVIATRPPAPRGVRTFHC